MRSVSLLDIDMDTAKHDALILRMPSTLVFEGSYADGDSRLHNRNTDQS